MENRKTLFNNLLKKLDNNKEICEEFKYLGTGNPLSNILIIGKEASIIKDEQKEQYNKEIVDNFNHWKSISDFNSDKIKDRQFHNYSPLFPYKGQVLKIDNGKNFGTSKTWYNYQKLFNYIFNFPNNDIIDFHKESFITEVNSTPSRKTVNAITDSIPFRKEHILSSNFFQSFPIVIISGVRYFETRKENNEIENIFKVNFTEKKFANKENGTQPYWVHLNKEKTKIVINTHQLSIGISDDLLKEVAKEIIKSKLI